MKYELWHVVSECQDPKLPFLGRTEPLHPFEPKTRSHEYRAVSGDEGYVWDRFGGPMGTLYPLAGFRVWFTEVEVGDHGRSKQAGSVGQPAYYLKGRLGNVVHGRVVSPRSESGGGLSTPWGVVILW